MRRILVILFLSLFLASYGHDPIWLVPDTIQTEKVDKWTLNKPYAQQTWGEKWDRPIAIILWNAAATTLGAVGDAVRDDGHNIGWALNGMEAGMFVGGKWMFNLKGFDEHAAYIASALFSRASKFDIQYNIYRGLPWYYTGSTKLWDKAWQAANPPPMGKGWFYGWCFILEISIPLKELR